MNNMTPSRHKPDCPVAISVGEKNKTYTLSVDASDPSEAIKALRAALRALEEGESHFAKGENNTRMIGYVAATERNKASQKAKAFDPASVELPAWLHKSTWDVWVQYRKEINRPIKSRLTVTQAINLLARCHDNGYHPAEIINASIANGWQGLFEPRQSKRPQQTRPRTVADNFFQKDYGTTQCPGWAQE
jgi:hypothetical protein